MPFDPARAKSLFLAASELADLAERAAYLERECGGDNQLRDWVETLLRVHDADPLPPAPCAEATIDSVDGRRHGDDFADPTARVGSIVAGKYKLMEEIGAGGMGSVFMAQQFEPVKRTVAVKVIKAGMDSKAVLARFDAERQALALMDHPNIARVLDAGTTESGRPFFVMELVKGVPITEYCDSRKLTPRQRLELFVPVCQAIQHAHQKGIIHRDIKPSNVLVALYDDRPVPKVIDFGVAKATGPALTDLSLMTGFGAVVGTPEYMSPEQASLNNLDIDTRSDVYSLGVLLYELLTGSTPVDKQSLGKAALLEILRIVREVEAPRPSFKLSSIDTLPSVAANRGTEPARLSNLMKGELDWVLLKALEKDRTRRYDTANALARDIQRYLADEVVEARPPSAGYRLRKFVRRHKGQVITASIVLLTLIGGVIGTTIGMMRAESARQTADLAMEGEKAERQKVEKLAVANAKLAADEGEAKNIAIEAKMENEKQLLRTKAILFTRQMERVAQVQEQNPTAALELLHDGEACPIDMRELAWNFVNNACKRQHLTSFPIPAARLHALCPNGSLFAVSSISRPDPVSKKIQEKVTLFEIPSGKKRGELPEFPDSVQMMAFSPDGSRLAVVADGYIRFSRDKEGEPLPRTKVPGKIQIWDVEKRQKLATLEGHADHVIALDFSSDGLLLATGSMDGTARIWDLKNAKELHAIKEIGKEVAAVAFSPDGKRLATGGLDNAIKLWNLEDFKLTSTWTPEPNPDPVLLAARNSESKMAPSQLGVGLGMTLAGNRDAVIALSFSPDGKNLASSSSNWLIEIREVASGRVVSTLRGINRAATWIKLARDGKNIYVSHSDRDFRELTNWDVTTGQKLQEFPDGELSLERSLLIVTERARQGNEECRVYDIDAPLERAKFETEPVKGNPSTVVFSRTGETLAVACGDRIFLWDVRTGQLRKTLVGHKNLVLGLAVSPDGRTLASTSTGGGSNFVGSVPESAPDDVRLWDISTGESLGTIPMGQKKIPSVAFSPDGATLATLHWKNDVDASSGVIMSIWDAKTRQLRYTLVPPELPFSLFLSKRARIAFNPVDGNLVLMAGRYLGVWDLQSRKLVWDTKVGSAAKFGGNDFMAMAISPNGKWIVTGNAYLAASRGVLEVKVWNAATGEFLKRIGGASATAIAFTPDGLNILMVSGATVQIWDTLMWQKRASFIAHWLPGTKDKAASGMVGIALSPDGQTLATALLPLKGNVSNVIVEGRAEVKLWDMSKSPSIVTIQSKGKASPLLMFSPDSKTLVENDQAQGVIRIWDLVAGRVHTTIDTTRKKIGTLLTPDGRYLAATDVPGTELQFSRILKTNSGKALTKAGTAQALVNLWDLKTNTLRTIEVGNGVPQGLAFSTDGRTMVIVHNTSIADDTVQDFGSSVEVWDLAQNKATSNWPFSKLQLTHPVFSPDGKALILVARDYEADPSRSGNLRVVVLDVQSGKILHTLHDASDDYLLRHFAFTKDGSRLVIRRGPVTGVATVWDWRNGKQLDGPVPEVFGNLDVSPNGRYELKRLSYGVEVIDRTVAPPAVVSQRRRP